ncbi:DgyrCDS9342 [Dimorphilus gyrociliatus]|uniref:DgyrCDS9342 n=1 Tax=Dimorphilus gyrociliatus TaxID=2664684 RepID=A0A7I8W1X5_9ANNE|nr:DgyrCDS9342 [Dimorphilus gyrociliatus]
MTYNRSLARVKVKNRISDMTLSRVIERIEEDRLIRIAHLDHDRLDVHDFLKEINYCKSDDLPESKIWLGDRVEALERRMQRRRNAERDVLTAPPGRVNNSVISVIAKPEPVRGKTAPEPTRNLPYVERKTARTARSPNVLKLSDKRPVTKHTVEKRQETKRNNFINVDDYQNENDVDTEEILADVRDEIELVAEENKPKSILLPSILNKHSDDISRPPSVVSFTDKPTRVVYTAVVHASHEDDTGNFSQYYNDEDNTEDDENSDQQEIKEKGAKEQTKSKLRKVSTTSSRKLKTGKLKKKPTPKPKKIEKKKEPEEVVLLPSTPSKSLIIRTPTANSMVRTRQPLVRSAIKRETLTPSRVSITTEDRNAFVMRQILTENSHMHRRSAKKSKQPLSQRINDFYEKIDKLRQEVDTAANWMPTPKKTKNLTKRNTLRTGGLRAALQLDIDD